MMNEDYIYLSEYDRIIKKVKNINFLKDVEDSYKCGKEKIIDIIQEFISNNANFENNTIDACELQKLLDKERLVL